MIIHASKWLPSAFGSPGISRPRLFVQGRGGCVWRQAHTLTYLSIYKYTPQHTLNALQHTGFGFVQAQIHNAEFSIQVLKCEVIATVGHSNQISSLKQKGFMKTGSHCLTMATRHLASVETVAIDNSATFSLHKTATIKSDNMSVIYKIWSKN